MIYTKRVVIQQAVSADGKTVAQATSVVITSEDVSSDRTPSIDSNQTVSTSVDSHRSRSQSTSQSTSQGYSQNHSASCSISRS